MKINGKVSWKFPTLRSSSWFDINFIVFSNKLHLWICLGKFNTCMKLSSCDVTSGNVLWRSAETAGQGEVDECTPKYLRPWLALGTPHLHKHTEETVLLPRRIPISGSKAIWTSRVPVNSHDYLKLISGCVWFQSRMCRRWLQGTCVKFGGLKTWHSYRNATTVCKWKNYIVLLKQAA